MSLRTIAVQMDGGPAAARRLDLGLHLAAVHGAHLVGMYAYGVEFPSAMAEAAIVPELMDMQTARADEERDRAAATFAERTAVAGLVGEWRVLEGEAVAAVALNGRYADLTLVGQADPERREWWIPADLPEMLTFALGGPVLVVPYIGWRDTCGQRVLVAWNGSREATRAVVDALPLLKAAASVTVLAINPGRDDHGDIPAADICLRLARHGIKAEASSITARGMGIGETLLARAADLSADLLVMGAYGHSRLRELVLSGATRTVLREMTIPVLMSH